MSTPTINLRTPNGYDGSRGTKYKQGIVRLATPQEAAAGTAMNVAITPAELAAAIAGAEAANFASPPVLGFGSTTPRPVHATTLSASSTSTLAAVTSTTLGSTGNTALASGAGATAALGNSTGTLGFFGSTGATRVSQAALTNSVTAGGTTGTIANYTDLTVYANDSNAIRNDIYQLSLALANVIAALRSYGLVA